MSEFDRSAMQMITDQLEHLRSLPFDEVSALAEVFEEREVTVSGRKCHLTCFVQSFEESQLLVTVQVSRSTFGLSGTKIEGGLIFAPNGEVRDATSEELRKSGG